MWFDRALRRTDPRPPAERLDLLARDLQILLNRANNAELERAGPVPLLKLKDVSPRELLDRKVAKVNEAAAHLLATTIELQNFSGGYFWTCVDGDLTLAELQAVLRKIGVPPLPLQLGRRPPRGKPTVPWRGVCRQFAQSVRIAMIDVGYKGSLAITNPNSVTAKVTASALSWAYRQRLSADAVVSAMRDRDRKKKTVR